MLNGFSLSNSHGGKAYELKTNIFVFLFRKLQYELFEYCYQYQIKILSIIYHYISYELKSYLRMG